MYWLHGLGSGLDRLAAARGGQIRVTQALAFSERQSQVELALDLGSGRAAESVLSQLRLRLLVFLAYHF